MAFLNMGSIDNLDDELKKMKQLLKEKEMKLKKYNEIKKLKEQKGAGPLLECREKQQKTSDQSHSGDLNHLQPSSISTHNKEIEKHDNIDQLEKKNKSIEDIGIQYSAVDVSHPLPQSEDYSDNNMQQSNCISSKPIEKENPSWCLGKSLEKQIVQSVPCVSSTGVIFLCLHPNSLSVLENKFNDESATQRHIISKSIELNNLFPAQKIHMLQFNIEESLSVGILNISQKCVDFLLLLNLEKQITKKIELPSNLSISDCCSTDTTITSPWSFSLLVSCDRFGCQNCDVTTVCDLSFDVIHSLKKNSWDLQFTWDGSSQEAPRANRLFVINQDDESLEAKFKYVLSYMDSRQISVMSEDNKTHSCFCLSNQDQPNVGQCIWARWIKGCLFLLVKNMDFVLVVVDIVLVDCFVLKSWKIASPSMMATSSKSLKAVFHNRMFYVTNTEGTMEILHCP